MLYSGLLFLVFIAQVYGRTTSTESKSSTLLLRGRVPASTEVEWDKDNKKSVPTVRTNGSKFTLKLVVKQKKNHRQITIIHP